MAFGVRDLLRSGVRAVVRVARPAGSSAAPGAAPRASLPDFDGRLTPVYAPDLDGDADPGEIVWTWVPYEDDPTRGKDRPVLVVGRAEPYLLGLMLTSKDHDRNTEREARHGRHWMDIGSGDWDARRRPSEVRLDRILTIDLRTIRREGAVAPRALFDEVTRSLAALKGW